MREYAWFGIILGLFAAILLAANNNTAAFRPDWYDDSILVAQRDGGNFLSGAGVDVAGADDPSNSQVDFTLTIATAYALPQSCTDGQIAKYATSTTSWLCGNDDGGGGGGEDLQGTYDLETAPALITLSDALGGIIFEGDSEVADPTFTVRDDSPAATDLGILVDNDDEAANEESPWIQLRNSTSAAGDDQFSLRVTSTGTFTILGDDDVADLTIGTDGEITFANTLAVTQLETAGTWAFAGTLSGTADITGAWTVNAAGSIDFASGADLLVASAQIDFDDLAGAAAIVTSSNTLTFGANAASNPTLTFDTDEATDATILFDALTDNRFETNKPWDFGTNAITGTGGIQITSGTINFTDNGISVDDLAATGTWEFAGTLSGAATVSGAWTFTGVEIFDGASASLEVPNAAGGRTVDAAGEVTVDTTSETVNYHDGTEERVLTPRYSKGFLFETPVATDDFALLRVDETSTTSNITLLEVCYLAIGGTNWIGQLQEGDANGGAGVDVHAADITAVAGTNNCSTSFSNAGIDNGDWILVKTTSISGTPTSLHITWYYDIDQ